MVETEATAPARQPDAIWEVKGAQKRNRVQTMFTEIAPVYDRVNGLMTMTMHHRWRAIATNMLGIKPGDSVADICSGTGDFSNQLRSALGSSSRILSVDFVLPMLQLATEKKVASVQTLGDACQLPIQSEQFQAVTVGWGIRNVPDIDLAHREIYRILKPGGTFVSLDTAVPKNKLIATLSRFACTKGLALLGSLFGHKNAYTYLPESTLRFWDRDKLCRSMESAGFVETRYKDLMFGNICIHFGRKPNPDTPK